MDARASQLQVNHDRIVRVLSARMHRAKKI